MTVYRTVHQNKSVSSADQYSILQHYGISRDDTTIVRKLSACITLDYYLILGCNSQWRKKLSQANHKRKTL